MVPGGSRQFQAGGGWQLVVQLNSKWFLHLRTRHPPSRCQRKWLSPQGHCGSSVYPRGV